MNRYSQNDEQDVILRFFGKRVGKFLDIGAFDGITFSNTRALAELGWSGVMVEPNPFSLTKLINSVKCFDKRVNIIAAAVGSIEQYSKLRIDETEGREWASSIYRHNPAVRQELKVNLLVPVITPWQLMILGPYAFIDIDAECMDFEILKSFKAHLGQCAMICVEPRDSEERKEMIALFEQYGFSIHHETPENIIAIRSG